MISGIRSLSSTHEQLIVGWTGDILNPETEPIPSSTITPEEKASFDDALAAQQGNLKDPEAEEEPDTKTHYVPVWMDDKVAHGHYDGYCKQSTYTSIQPLSPLTSYAVLWPLFHYLLWQDAATEYASADMHYPYYESANAIFSRRITEVYRPGDLIWIHDYHLLLLPR